MKLLIGKKSLHEATATIQELVADPNTNITGHEEIFRYAKAGKPGYDVKAQKIVKELMNCYGIKVTGMESDEVAEKIYEYLWGLDVAEKIYRMPHVDEVRVNNPNNVYYQDRGVTVKANVKFRDNEHIRKIIARMIEHDRACLDESNPGCESRRLDGARLTALTYPLAKGPCFVIRKHGTFDISEESYITSGTMSRYILYLLSLLVKGRANILICGDANVGKTTLLRFLTRYLHPKLRIVVIETDRELLIDEWYPDRDVLSIESHPELGWDMKRCFPLALRLSPNVIIVGEARGLGEAGQMINAIRSGHHGSMGTLHVFSVYEAVRVLAQMALEEGRRLPISLLEDQVAAAFNIIVQMYGNSVTGVKRVEQVVEVWRGKDGSEFNNLCVWEPSDENYEIGCWKYPNGISQRLAVKLFKYGVSKAELEELERMRSDG